jgi:Tfp pilus assembly protein PilO
MKAIAQNIENQRVDLEIKYIRGQSLKKLTKNIRTIEPQMDKLGSIFIKEGEELNFITTLENLANANNIDQKINLEIDKKTIIKGLKKIPVKISSSGSFKNILNYLSGLEKLDYYINIGSISLSSSQQKASSVNQEQVIENKINMSLNAYVYLK